MEATETTLSCRNLRGVNLLKEGLLGTAAMRRANLVPRLEIGMGVGLILAA